MRAAAYRKAIEYAKCISDKNRVSRKIGPWLHRRKSSSVFRFVNLRKPNKPAIWIAVASIQEGKPERRYFYVTKYGERKAKQLTQRARAERVGILVAVRRHAGVKRALLVNHVGKR